MLLTKTVFTKWNSRTKKYYENLGYNYTKMGDIIEVSVYDLPKRSEAKVFVSCDYCQKEYYVLWSHRTKSVDECEIKKDACHKCSFFKIREIMIVVYGVECGMDIPSSREKHRNTIMKKYGVENVFQNEEIKRKIKASNIQKYGVSSYTQTEEYLQKRTSTCLEKYGVDNWMKMPENIGIFRAEKSPRWKGGIHDERWERLQPRYKEWRYLVFKKYNFICQKCMKKPEYLEAHHIKNWNKVEEERYNVENGIPFCKQCHIDFHRIYGKRKNSLDQVLEFLQ